jgi:ribosomal protein S18 acetylase RimI-like enzyme
MPPFSVLEYASADAAPLADLAAAAFEQYKHQYVDWPEFQARLRRMPELSSDAEIVIAKSGPRIVGAVAYVGPNKPKLQFFEPEWPIMRMLVVSPEARGAGIGRALASECVARAERDGASVFALHTSEIMEVALAMYERMGFERYAATPDIHGVRYAIYLKSLAGASS